MKIRVAAAFLCLTASGAAAAPPVTSFTLENGLQGVVIEDHRAPVVTQMIWYRVGSADETQGETGLAHFLEHLMFKGTDKIPTGAFSKVIAENGGQDNAFTSYDYTAYFQRIAADRLDLVMGMEADRMVNLRLTDEVVLPERDVVLEERNMRVENDPSARFREQMNAALYLNHPYGSPVIGWRSEIEALSREDALKFYKAHYSPDNAILIIAGDVSPDEAEAMAQKHFGAIPAAGAMARNRPAEPPQLAARRIEMSDPRVRQPYVIRTYLAPSRRMAGDETAAALAILSEVLGGGGVTSRLSKQLEIADGSAISSGAWYDGSAYDNGTFSVYAVPAEGVSLDLVEEGFTGVLARLADEGPTEEELARARTKIRAAAIYAEDNQQGLAQKYGAGLATGLSIERIEAWPDKLAAVTAEDVKQAATLLRIEASVTGRLLQAEEAAE